MDLATAIQTYANLYQVRGNEEITSAMDILAKYIKQEVEKSTQSPTTNPTAPIHS